MFTTEIHGEATLDSPDDDIVQRILSGKLLSSSEGCKPLPHLASPLIMPEAGAQNSTRPIVALFCCEPADSAIGQFVSGLAASLAGEERAVHLFVRHPYDSAAVAVHRVSVCSDGDLVDQAQEFARQVADQFIRLVGFSTAPIALMGFEWSSLPVLTRLQGLKNARLVWSMHSLERQRSDMTGELSKRIEEVEMAGLRAAHAVLAHDPATLNLASALSPESGARLVEAQPMFPVARFASQLDAGQIKARYQIGPVDPTILFVGDLSERYGPDLLVKAMPAILKNHPQARLVVVGSGSQYWPLRVFTRYLLLEHAIRLVGHMEGQALQELIQAADVLAVPSRDSTPWWPIQAGWAARCPVVATHQAAPGLLAHEQDGVLCYPSENSCVWAIERILFDAELGKTLARRGYEKLQERFGLASVMAQVENLLGVAAAPKG